LSVPKLREGIVVAMVVMAACAGNEGTKRAGEATAGPKACTDDEIVQRAQGAESTRQELAHLRADYRDTDGVPTAKVNVRLRPGSSIADLVAKHGALEHVPVANLPGWYTLTYADSKSAQAAVRPLLCDPVVERAELNLKRPHVPRNKRY